MGASMSQTYSGELKNPTRTLQTELRVHPHSKTFTFTQRMCKSVGEEQTLRTVLRLSGHISTVVTDSIDPISGRVIKGNPTMIARPDRGVCDVEWGGEYYQCKRIKLQRRDLYEESLRRTSKSGKVGVAPLNPPVAAAPAPAPTLLPTPGSQQRAFSFNAPVPRSPRSQSRADADKLFDMAAAAAQKNRSPKTDSVNSIRVAYNGEHHDALQKSTSLEGMTELLQRDVDDWLAVFSFDALNLNVECLSQEIRIGYVRLRLEYLWAAVAEQCPIIMALSNVFLDHSPVDLYLPIPTNNKH